MEIGCKGCHHITVTLADTALALGSGEGHVLATPKLVALIEETAWRSVAPHLATEESTVGTQLSVRHLAPTPVGMTVTCETTLVEVNGRRLVFEATVRDEREVIGEARHERVIIKMDRFQQKADGKRS